MKESVWQQQQQFFRQRMAEVGATPLFALKNQDASVLMSLTDFGAHEGVYDDEPFLRLQLCTAHMGKIYRNGSDGVQVEGTLRPGTFGLNLPHVPAEGYWPRNQSLTIVVKPDHISDYAPETVTLESLTPAAAHLHQDPLISSVMTALWYDAEAHGLSSAFFEHGLAVILKRLSEFKIQAVNGTAKLAYPLSKTQFSKVREVIETRLSSDLRIKDLADECGQDIRSFTRSFRATTGVAPYEYLTNCRMDKAKQLLLTSVPVTEIAFSVGYSNPSKFAAAFRRFHGCSPTQWRRSQN